jgi:putative DNA primase/helicase
MQNFSLKNIASALGGEVSGSQVRAPGPGHSRKDRSLAIALSATEPRGFVVYSHAGDDWLECLSYTCERLGIKNDARINTCERPARPIAATEPRRGQGDAKGKQDFAGRIWRESVDSRGTLVEHYLNSRELELPDEVAGLVIRFHPSCPFGQERHPAMVCLVSNIVTDEPQAIHRTAMNPDGTAVKRDGKTYRLSLGPIAGGAIKLDADENVTQGLAIGEGVETCLTARQRGWRPVWAMGHVGGIETFPVLAGIEALTFLAEDGASSARAICICGHHWKAAGREVFGVDPTIGSDLNDALREFVT